MQTVLTDSSKRDYGVGDTAIIRHYNSQCYQHFLLTPKHGEIQCKTSRFVTAGLLPDSDNLNMLSQVYTTPRLTMQRSLCSPDMISIHHSLICDNYVAKIRCMISSTGLAFYNIWPVSFPNCSSANAVILNGSEICVNNAFSILSVSITQQSSSECSFFHSRMQQQWARCPGTQAEWQLLKRTIQVLLLLFCFFTCVTILSQIESTNILQTIMLNLKYIAIIPGIHLFLVISEWNRNLNNKWSWAAKFSPDLELSQLKFYSIALARLSTKP